MSVISCTNDRDNEYRWREGEAQRCFATTIKTATKNITNFNSKSSILNYFFITQAMVYKTIITIILLVLAAVDVQQDHRSSSNHDSWEPVR